MDATLAAPSAGALVPGWIGSRAFDVEGARIGHVADVLFDAHTHSAGWVLLALPQVVEHWVLAPARGLLHRADGVQLACARELVRTAPVSAAPPDALTRSDALVLAAHYGVRCGAGPWLGVVEPAFAGAGARMRITG